jgi:hypothetical protein
MVSDYDQVICGEALRKTILVFKGGVAYAPAEIHGALGIPPFAKAPAIVKAATK